MTRCSICGLDHKIVITCQGCSRNICLFDFWCAKGLCADCIVKEYREKYADKIENYHEGAKPKILQSGEVIA